MPFLLLFLLWLIFLLLLLFENFDDVGIIVIASIINDGGEEGILDALFDMDALSDKDTDSEFDADPDIVPVDVSEIEAVTLII